jgi:uncharacterized protein with PIN domain
MILAPKGKSIAEERQLFPVNKAQAAKLKRIQTLGEMPNIAGQWFPSFEPRCPICNEPLVNLSSLNYKVGFGQLVCPKCGYKKT